MYVVILYNLALGVNNILEILNGFLLDLQIDLHLDVLKLEDMVFYNKFEEIALILEFNYFGNAISNEFSICNILN